MLLATTLNILVITSVSSKLRRPLLSRNDQEPRETFDELVASNMYVDRTKFIEYFISGSKHLVILAPRGFGKTTNLSMLRLFLERQEDTTENSASAKAIISKRRDLFRRLEIAEDESFFEKHFAKYPLMYLDFARLDFQDNHTFRRSFCELIKGSFADHRYLLNYSTLLEGDRKTLKRYLEPSCDGGESLITAGRALSDLLHHYLSEPCIVLIDDYDKPATLATFSSSVSSLDCDQIFNDLGKFLELLLKDNPHVRHSLQVGILRLSGVYDPYADHLRYVRIFDDVTIGRWFGFTYREVDKLSKRIGFEIVQSELTKWYGGYETVKGGEAMFIPQSIIRYLTRKKFRYYWNGALGVNYLQKLLILEKFGAKFVRAVEKKFWTTGDCIGHEFCLEYTKDRFTALKKLVSDDMVTRQFVAHQQEAMWQFLFENGHFYRYPEKTFMNQKLSERILAMFPNLEASRPFWDMIELKSYFAFRKNAEPMLLNAYSSSFEGFYSPLIRFQNFARLMMNYLESVEPVALYDSDFTLPNEVFMELRRRNNETYQLRLVEERFGKYVILKKELNFVGPPDFILIVEDQDLSERDILRRVLDDGSHIPWFPMKSKCLIGLRSDEIALNFAFLYNSTNINDARMVKVDKNIKTEEKIDV